MRQARLNSLFTPKATATVSNPDSVAGSSNAQTGPENDLADLRVPSPPAAPNEDKGTVPNPPVVSAPPKSMKNIHDYVNVKTTALKAEVWWAMKCAISKYSFTSVDNSGNLFREMFPDSQVARHFQMGHTKVSYMISHGLGPYFQREMVNDVRSSETFFTLHYDETVTNQSKKQLDILIRYFSGTLQRIQVRFLSALFFGHAYADRVV